MNKFVIVNVEGSFWSGSSWVAEYPDAETYETEKAARAAGTVARRSCSCEIIANYGLDTERPVAKLDALFK